MNAEFPRIARRDNEAFLSEQCKKKKRKKTVEWERLEISSSKLGAIKGISHARIGTIKDRNSMDLTEAEETKKRRQEVLLYRTIQKTIQEGS